MKRTKEIVGTGVSIPDFTANDFYNTSKPYEYLYSFADNKFELSQIREKLKARAAEVGVRGFIALWDAYLETIQKRKGVVMTENATQYEGQAIELMSGEYICSEKGVTVSDRYGYDQIICRHPIMPIQRLVNIDSGEERLRIAFKKGRRWRDIIVEKSVLASSNSILQLASKGIMVNSENAKALSTFLLEIEQMNYEIIPEQKSVGRLGWVGTHGFSPYVDGLDFDGENNFKHIFSSVRSEGSFDEWTEIMRKMRAERGMGRIFLAASFASVIIEPCGLLPFFVHAWGGTEVGKTVGLMIAASVWASPKMGDYITTFNSTLIGQEMMATFLNSLPMCIDELQIQSSAGIHDFDKIIYQLTEGVGRTRGAKTGGLQKINSWKNCIITNGEHPISNSNSGGGAVNRIIEFECSEKVYSDLVGMCAVINKNYGHAGRKFIKHLQEDGVLDKVNTLQKEYYQELLKANSTDKQAASASAILAADKVATDLIFKDGNNLQVEDMAKIMTKKDEVDVNHRAYEYIMELVARNPNKFYKNDFGDWQGEVWGKIEEKHIYIIKSIFDREMQNAGFNGTAFLAWAKRANLISCDDSKRTKKYRITSNPINCVCFIRNSDNEQ